MYQFLAKYQNLFGIKTGISPIHNNDMHPQRFVKPHVAESLLGVDRRTLKKWAEQDLIKSLRPGGKGQTLFDVSSVVSTVTSSATPHSITTSQAVSATPTPKRKAIYARVSTQKQKPFLTTQLEQLKQKYPDHDVYFDIASGINFKRKGLLSLLQLAFEGRLQCVCIAYRDRLCRFAYDLLEYVFKQHGVQIIVDSHEVDTTAERELADDVLSVLTVFGARLYGSRSGNKRKRAAEKEAQDGDNAIKGPQGKHRNEHPDKKARTTKNIGSGAHSNVQNSNEPHIGTTL